MELGVDTDRDVDADVEPELGKIETDGPGGSEEKCGGDASGTELGVLLESVSSCFKANDISNELPFDGNGSSREFLGTLGFAGRGEVNRCLASFQKSELPFKSGIHVDTLSLSLSNLPPPRSFTSRRVLCSL